MKVPWNMVPGTGIFIPNPKIMTLREREKKHYRAGSKLLLYTRILMKQVNLSISVLS